MADAFLTGEYSFAELAREYGISLPRAREIILDRIGENRIRKIKEQRKAENAFKKREAKRNLSPEQRAKKIAYMKKYNQNYVRPERRQEEF